jgi:WS/DGAT/MGAT family acyltransferase
MPRTYYERLSPQSASFLVREGSRTFSHTSVLLVFEPGSLARPSGGVDFDAIRSGVEARLSAVPRARQKLRWIPLENHPIWVDDPDFSLEYHLRHTSLPRPGNEEQLRRMVARIHAQRLDRSRPLWECWVLEGLEDGRFAMLWKTHHCMVDPASEEDLIEALLSPEPHPPEPRHVGYKPRPMPSAYELVRDEVVRQARIPRRSLERFQDALRSDAWRHDLELRLRSVAKLLGYSIRPRGQNALSGPAGPHRRFARLVVPLEKAQQVHRALDAPLHDVLLAVLAGAIRAFFLERLVNPATIDFRVSAPVTLDPEASQAAGGRVAGAPGAESETVGEWIVEMPIWEKDPRERVARVRAQTEKLHAASPGLGARTLAGLAEWTGSRRLGLGARAVSQRSVDLAVVNLPGPQTPLYFRGARLLEGFGIAPLREDHALAVTIMSYDGKLCWALNADFDRLPDLDRFAAALDASFEELHRAARGGAKLSVVQSAEA